MAIAKQFLQASSARKEKDPSSSIIDMKINFPALVCTVLHWPAQSTVRPAASVMMKGRWNGGEEDEERWRRGVTYSCDIVADHYICCCVHAPEVWMKTSIVKCQPTDMWTAHAGNTLRLSLVLIPLFSFSSPLFLLITSPSVSETAESFRFSFRRNKPCHDCLHLPH